MGLAVGIDYTLFIVSRFREELARGRSTVDAVAAASGTAGRAVFFSGLTVVLALLGMLIVPNTLFTSLGARAPSSWWLRLCSRRSRCCPPLLSLLGDACQPAQAARTWDVVSLGTRASGESSIWARVRNGVMRRPAIALAIGVAVLLLAASPLFGMKTAVSSVKNLPGSFEAKKAFAVLKIATSRVAR